MTRPSLFHLLSNLSTSLRRVDSKSPTAADLTTDGSRDGVWIACRSAAAIRLPYRLDISPPPFFDACRFQPSSKPLRALRAQNEWTLTLLRDVRCALCTALKGVPVHCRLPVHIASLSPVSEWISAMSRWQRGWKRTSRNCLTAEFALQ